MMYNYYEIIKDKPEFEKYFLDECDKKHTEEVEEAKKNGTMILDGKYWFINATEDEDVVKEIYEEFMKLESAK
ncbi:hypothetical protein [Anaerorhabdus sp.]|uniref:hypothetical protein n=1 Tax=Anaerorhabdus sp. TaxID=1872524 RepID=UPI002FCA1656